MEIQRIAAADLARFAAVTFAQKIRGAVTQRGIAHVAFSGGTTPATCLEFLASMSIPWESTEIWQVDERCAPDGDTARNATGLTEHLLRHISIPEESVHLMNVGDPDGAAAYERLLEERCGGVLDVVHLGLGSDGHTASWPPKDSVLDTTADVAWSGIYMGYVRMTLTPPLVNRAGSRIFLVGSGKEDALRLLINGDHEIPAAAVRRDSTLVFAPIE
jgi:6-phosphogluconolactonase